jgi:cytochrome oxidase Cu insertion factor (SCO1/SenC/PrrC family)
MEAGARAHDAQRGGRIRPIHVVGVLVAAVLVGAVVGVAAHQLAAKHSSPPPAAAAAPRANQLAGQATWAAGVRPAPAINTLHDQSGNLFSWASLRGHNVAMEFFDSHCTQECPLAGRALAAAERALPAAQRPTLVVVSVNPLDTPASTRAAIRKWDLAGVGRWYWLRGTHAQLAPVWNAYHIYVKPMAGDISHTEALYLIDGHGDERSGFLYPYIPVTVAHDMHVLARAQADKAKGRA